MLAKAKVVAWLLSAITAWSASPIPKEERANAAEVRHKVAEDMVDVAYDPDEVPYYAGPYGRAITALNATSLGALESRFAEHIITGHCRPHECDGGKASGMMQVHLGDHGLRLLPKGKSEQCHADSAECLTKDDLLEDWSLQIRTGLHILRTQGFGAFSPANEARSQAAEWLAKHPPPATDAEVMAQGGVAEAQR